MDVNPKQLEAMGRRTAEMQEQALRRHVRPTTDERLATIAKLRAERSGIPSSGRSYVRSGRALNLRRALLAAAVLMSAAAAWLLWIRFPSPNLSYQVGGAEALAGQWVGSDDEPTSLRFSDGSRVEVQRGARARVTELGSNGANVLVERGSLHVDVVHRDVTHWSITGGPFEVHVLGTEFDVAWDAASEELSVTMGTGHVRIEGPCIAPASRFISAPERVRIRCVAEPPAPAGADSGAEPGPPPPVNNEPLPMELDALSATPSPPPPAQPAWRSQLAKGHSKEAFTEAQSLGIATILEQASGRELLELGSAARLAGEAATATQFYQRTRTRFPNSDSAGLAAYHLGRMAFDGRGAWSEAERWFGVYLAEHPGGSLAAEALGRSLECANHQGDSPRVRAMAKRYLEAYPKGPHAALAEQLSSEPKP